jgi:hypothetical protein
LGVINSCVPLTDGKQWVSALTAQRVATLSRSLNFYLFQFWRFFMGKASFKNIRVSAVYVGDEAAPFNPANYHNHRVRVYNADNGKRTSCQIAA